MRNIFLKSIRFYQKYLSFDSGLLKRLFLTDKACRFYPSCSEYSYQAIRKYGIIFGSWLSLKRILKCKYQKSKTSLKLKNKTSFSFDLGFDI